MSLNDTPLAERVHIAFFGMRNAGKSSLVNAVTGQNVSIVSEKKGTTTDPVYKNMELLPLGPVTIIDTPGFDDDEETLGKLRVEKAVHTLRKTDIAVLVKDSSLPFSETEKTLVSEFEKLNVPYIIAQNKCDLIQNINSQNGNTVFVSAKTGKGITELKEKIASLNLLKTQSRKLLDGIANKGDALILVVPIDKAAPKGRLILPQQQVIREALDSGCVAVITRDEELEQTLKTVNNPSFVICDSQVFSYTASVVPESIPLTSFSILMARYKGFLDTALKGVTKISKLTEKSKVIISEGCTHHRQCGDIGTVKIPALIEKFTKVRPKYKFTSGQDFSEEIIKDADLVIHCGGCMLNEREMQFRQNIALNCGVPFTNYGTAISYMSGILKRSIKDIPEYRNFDI